MYCSLGRPNIARPAGAVVVRNMAIGLLVTLTALPLLGVVEAQAQQVTTYVSGRGKDSGNCSASSPCLTLQAALAKTLPGGQINALDSANYGYVTITKAVSIISGGSATGVLAPSNVSGVTIAAGANDTVELRGLVIDGAGSGANGILFTSGASLNVQDSVIRGFATGINFQPTGSSTLLVGGTLISTNATGVSLQSSATSSAVLDDVEVLNNATGIAANGLSRSLTMSRMCDRRASTRLGVKAAEARPRMRV